MAREEFDICPKCGVAKMKPTGLAETSADPQTNRKSGNLSGDKCDNCGYPESGEAKVSQANGQVNLGESANIKSAASGNSYDPTAS